MAQAAAGAGFSLVAEHTGHISKSVAASAGTPLTVHKPSGGTVLAAYLAYATTGFSGTVLTSPVVLNGQPVPLANQVPTGIGSYNYFTPVTSLVKPLIDGSAAGSVTVPMSEGDPGLTEGEILTVVYDDPSVSTDQSVSIVYGALDPAGDTFGINLASPVDTSSAATHLEMSLGISFSYQANATQQYSILAVNGQRLSTAAGGEDDGGPGNGTLITAGGEGDSPANPTDPYATPTGPRSDDELYDLRGFAEDGDQTVSASTINPSADDNAFLAVLTTNPPVSGVTTGLGVGSFQGGRTLGEMMGPNNTAETICSCNTGSDPVSASTGNLWHTEHDVQLPGRGVVLDESRTYNALVAAAATGTSPPGRFGLGWSDTYSAHLQVDGSGNVTVTQGDGSTLPFQAQPNGTFLGSPSSTAHLSRNAAGTYTLTYHDKTQVLYDSTGRLTTQRDRNGYLTTMAYAGGNLSTVTDPAGRHLVFAYNADGTVSSLTDPAGHVTHYTYDGSGNLASTTDASGAVWAYTYDASHVLLSLTDPNGGVTTNTYDLHHRVTRQVDPAGRATTWEYTGSMDYGSGPAGRTLVTDPLGRATLYDFDGRGAVVTRTDAYGTADAAAWTFAYDPATGTQTSATDPAGGTTQYSWDSRVNLLTRTDPDANTTTLTYTTRNDVASVTDPNGVTTTRTYDARGNLVSVSTPSGTATGPVTTLLEHGDAAHPGDVTAVTDPSGRVVHYGYDQAGNLTSATDAAGETTTWAYDGDGRQTSVTTPRGNATGANATLFTTACTRDQDGRITRVAAPEGAVTTLGYDQLGNLTSRTDPNQHTTHWTYDPDNEVTVTTRPDGSTVKATWDAAGQRTSAIDGNNKTTTYGYDMLGREVSTTDPLGRVTHSTWDAAGQLATVTDALGRVTTYAYDQAGLRTSINYSDPATPDVSFGYDADGHMTSMTDGIGNSSWTYDNLGRVTNSVNGYGSHLGFSYDLAGRVTALTYPDTRVSAKTYDTVGRMASVSDGGGHTTTFGYDPDGNLTQLAYPDGSTGTRAYDHAGAVTSIIDTHPDAVGDGTSTWLNLPYTRTASGQVATQNTTAVPAPGTVSATTVTPETFARDGNDRVTGVTVGPLNAGTLESYGYNPGDDPTSRLDHLGVNGTGVTTALSYDAAHQLTHTSNSVLAEDFTYDQVGDRTGSTITAGGQQFTTRLEYDQAGRLTDYQGVPLTVANQTLTQILGGNPNLNLGIKYDGLGRRADLTYSTAETSVPLVVNDTLHDFIRGPGGMIIETALAVTGSVNINGSTFTGPAVIHHTDQLGSTRLTADTDGHLLTSYTYDAYGRATTATLSHITGVDPGTVATPIGYAGGYTDIPTGLLYLLNRYYDPYTGQFITRDPIVAMSQSAYGYVNNDPLDGTDPLGLMCFSAHCLLHGVSQATTVIQTGLDLVAVGAAAVGAEPVAGALLGVSETVGYVNVAATCADALTGATGAATGTDCAASIAISVGTAGLGRLVAPGVTRNGRQVFDQVELAARGSINSFGDLLGWERGWKTGDGSTCPGTPVQPEFAPAP